MSRNAHPIIPFVPTYLPAPPTNNGDREGEHTHISTSLESVGRVWPALHEMPEPAYPSLPRIIPTQLAIGDMDVETPNQPDDHGEGEAVKSHAPDQPPTPKLAPLDGMQMHPSPIRLAPFIVDQQKGTVPDEVFTPIPTRCAFSGSQGLLTPGVLPEDLKARKESSTLGLVIDDSPDSTSNLVDEVIQTAKHGWPSRAHMVRLSPLSLKQDDLLDSPNSPTSKQKLPTPLLPKIMVHVGDVSSDAEPKSPFEAYSPLISAPPRDAIFEVSHDDVASMRRSHGGTTDKSGVEPGMTPSLAEIMDRVGVTAKRNRLDFHD